MKIEAGWTGLDGAIAGLIGVDKETALAMSKAIKKGTNHARRHVRKAVPRKAKGPHRVASTGVRTRVKGKGMQTRGETYLAQAAIPLAKGQKPHDIPARGKAVKFNGDNFAKVVHHPGARPNPFFKTGIKNAEPDIVKELDAAGIEVLSSISKAIAADRG